MPDARTSPPRKASSRGRLKMLVAANVGLVLALGWQAIAQPSTDRPSREKGRYTLVSGAFLGGLADAVYLVDAENRELAAIRYDPAARTVRVAGYRDLARDVQQRPGR